MGIISLCAGYEGLGAAVEEVTGDEVVAYAEIHPAACRVLEHRFPGRPNIGDITTADWEAVRDAFPDADIVAAGFPCSDISNAGPRTGISGERSGIWKNVAEAVGVLRPRLVFLENVSVIRGRGLSTVAEDLAALGYELRWTCIRASDTGAPHPRDRWFGVARPVRNADGGGRNGGTGDIGQADRRDEPAHAGDAVPDAEGDRRAERRPEPARFVGELDVSGPGAPAGRLGVGQRQGLRSGCPPMGGADRNSGAASGGRRSEVQGRT